MTLETPEEFYARVAAAADEDGRLPVAAEEMPGWDVFPYEIDSLRIKPLGPLADAEPARRGELAGECWCADPDPGAGSHGGVVWRNERWRVVLSRQARVPVFLTLEPLEHYDFGDLPDRLAEEMGLLLVAVAQAIEALPSVGRAHQYRIGDGGAHLHLMFFGRPRRILQFRGSPLLDWEENLPLLPDEVHRAHGAYVGARLVERVGGTGPDVTGPA